MVVCAGLNVDHKVVQWEHKVFSWPQGVAAILTEINSRSVICGKWIMVTLAKIRPGNNIFHYRLIYSLTFGDRMSSTLSLTVVKGMLVPVMYP